MAKLQHLTMVSMVLLAGMSVATAQQLTPYKDVCFARIYSKAHLAKNPDQRVATISFSHFPSRYNTDQMNMAKGNIGQYGPDFTSYVSVRFIDNTIRYDQWVLCNERGSGYRCGVECDGGYFDLRFKSDGAALIDFRKSHGMVLNASCGEGQYIRWLGDGSSDDTLFRLDPAPLSACE